jgi:two-component system phosphate regulon sensor histidine kinase PhoR
MLVLTDISELTRTVQVRMDFASNASHELRTPLSAIRAAVETLMNIDLATDKDSARHFMDMIDRHSGRMEEMISDLLDLSKIESSLSRFKPQDVNLPQILDDLRARYLDRLEAKQLQWLLDVPPDLINIVANPYLLGIVLDNLVDNSIKFTDIGGRISIFCRRETDEEKGRKVVCIEVADNGCGIAEDEKDRVFERFYQVEKSRSGEDRGTGLGLSIVRHAVTALGGMVSLQSQPGEGTQVTVTLSQ